MCSAWAYGGALILILAVGSFVMQVGCRWSDIAILARTRKVISAFEQVRSCCLRALIDLQLLRPHLFQRLKRLLRDSILLFSSHPQAFKKAGLPTYSTVQHSPKKKLNLEKSKEVMFFFLLQRMFFSLVCST
jgi:hypothetical protein